VIYDKPQPLEVFNSAGDAQKRATELNARAAIEALREPSEKMMAAGNHHDIASDEDRWRRMIDAALAEGDGK
jgi:hypothetical protein